MAFLLGYDVGSSFIKAALMESDTGKVLAAATCPQKELDIAAERPGWAEQDPYVWWENVKAATAEIKAKFNFNIKNVRAIGISYQMHGLVAVDKNQQVLRRAIIWCDSRAVETGRRAAEEIGQEKCLKTMLNLPGNFTASKLKWVMENQPDIYSRIHKIMLPGDYIAMKMTGEIKTTASGLSEGIMWDFQQECPADLLLEYYGIDRRLIPEVVPTFSVQGVLTKDAAEQLGLKAGTAVSYRAGDQPNNAFSLNVLNAGQAAATAGTSGVVYGISATPDYDSRSRVNTFVHVNHTPQQRRYGVLLCLNGAGILNSWLRHNVTDSLTYEQMNELAGQVPIGAEGLLVFPYGNGAERTLENRNIGAFVYGLNFNIHKTKHLVRAAQEGIVFAMNYGLGIMRNVGVQATTVRAGNANMFLSDVFTQAFAAVTQAGVQLYNTDGAQGAARGAGVGAGVYKNISDAFVGLEPVRTVVPEKQLADAYLEVYTKWQGILEQHLRS